MLRASHPISPVVLVCKAVVCLLLCATVAGCGTSDPLDAISEQQASGDFEGTIEPLRALLAERPDDSRVNFLYGRALTAMGQASLAEWSLRKAAEDPEWLGRAGTQLIVGALATGNYDTAIEIASVVLESDPENLNVMLLRAQAYSRSRKYRDEALTEANRILELDPGNTDAMEPKIVSLLKLERIEEAAEAIELLGKWIEEKEVGTHLRGWHCATEAIFADESDEDELAAERWVACLEAFPGHPNVVGGALDFYDERRDFARSLEIMQAAHEAEPDSLDYSKQLAVRLTLAGRPEEAEQLLVESVESVTPILRPIVWVDLAKHYQDVGDPEKAANAIEQAVKTSREQGEVPAQLLFEHADSLVLSGDFEGALAVSDEMTLEPHRELIRARVAQERGQHQKALDHYQAGFRLWPDNPWARYYAALAAEAVGDFDAAIEAYRYSMRIDAGATDARTRLARLLVAEGHIEEARHMLFLFKDKMPLDLDGELFLIRVTAWMGHSADVKESLERFAKVGPELHGRALVSAAEGVRDRSGPADAARMLRGFGAEGMAVQEPANPVALRALLKFSHDAGEIEALEDVIRVNLTAHGRSAAIHEMLGLWLELSGAPADETRAAYSRAVKLDPQNVGGLLGLGKIAAGSDPEAALALFDRAAEAAPDDPAPKLEAARVLIALGRAQEAEQRLAKLLELHPHEGPAAAEWAELQLAQQTASAQTEALAKRAVRFRGGADALDLLARVYRALDDPEQASEAEARARTLRERRAPPA